MVEMGGLAFRRPVLTFPARQGFEADRQAAHLDHVTLTHEPVYDGAAVTAVRSLAESRPAQTWRADLLRAQGILARLAGPG